MAATELTIMVSDTCSADDQRTAPLPLFAYLSVVSAGQCETGHGDGRFFDAFLPERVTRTPVLPNSEFGDQLRAVRLISSQPSGVTVARSSGRSSTVVIADSTIAGPWIACAGAKLSKSHTGAVTHSSSQIRRSERGAAGG